MSSLALVSTLPTFHDVLAAKRRIEGISRITPTRLSRWLSELVGVAVWLKLETEQETGSFKVRGAANALLQLTEPERAAGVVAVSSGNHGRAVAFVANRLGVGATICLSSRVPAVKVEAIEALGARVVVAGPDQEAAEAAAHRLVSDDGLVFIHPFDDPRVIAGQGTVGLEVVEQVSDVATVIVPLSGGGLAGGIAVVVKAHDPTVSMVGVSQDRGPAMIESIRAGRIVEVDEVDTLADALAGGLGDHNDHSYALCRDLLDQTAVVTEDEIGAAMAGLYRHEGLTVEGGGAVGVAALMAGRIRPRDATVVVISGGNVAPEIVDRVIALHG